MLAKKYRLSKNKDFQNVFKKGKWVKEKFIFLKAVKNNLEFSRFGFIISNKISKKSVERHKIKRRLSAIINSRLKEISTGWDVVIIVDKEIKDRTYQEIEETLANALRKIRLIEQSNGESL